MKFDWTLLWTSIKEPLRLLLLAVVSFLLVQIAGVDSEWAAILTIILRFVDSYLHELGKEKSTKKEEHFLVKGLTRF